MAETWPASLPQNLTAQGLKFKAADNTLRTQVDVGPAKMRRRTTANVEPLSGPMVMTEAQLSEFETFYKTALADGTKAFYFPNPRNNSQLLLVRFSAPYEGSVTGPGLFMISLPLEILP